MRIGLYFGSFNPVHVGHLIIANHVINAREVDQVWFVVSPQNPHKHSSTLLNEYHRLHLIQLALGDDTKLKTCDFEFSLPKPSYTIDTLIYLKEKYPLHQFSIIIGSDSYQNLPGWKSASLLIKDYKFLIYVRPGFEVANVYRDDHKLLTAPLLDISASLIRKLIADKKSIRYLVPDAVRTEIEKSGYYK